MVTYLSDYRNEQYQTSATDVFNGVVSVSNGQSRGTGTLLYDGRSILTAAHIFEGYHTRNIIVYFDTLYGSYSLDATIAVYDEYDSYNSNGDIAILTLEENVLDLYQRYDLYRDTDEITQDFSMVGYGNYGTGRTGEVTSGTTSLKLQVQNTFDTDFYTIDLDSSTNLTWDPLEDAILAADFDSGLDENDTFGLFLDIKDTGVGTMEGMIASGDSGGPAFINGAVAGVASYTSAIYTSRIDPDVTSDLDSSFGEIGAWQRVSYYQEWIDKTIRANYENTPTSAEEVETSVVESDYDVTYTYFLLEFLEDRASVDGNIILSYSTRDGSARAGEDYIGLSGTITLYEDESSVLIPVEIIGDTLVEGEEDFYLDISSPNYGSLGNGIELISASRTIIDDESFIA